MIAKSLEKAVGLFYHIHKLVGYLPTIWPLLVIQ